jgi:hypothetical protein
MDKIHLPYEIWKHLSKHKYEHSILKNKILDRMSLVSETAGRGTMFAPQAVCCSVSIMRDTG